MTYADLVAARAIVAEVRNRAGVPVLVLAAITDATEVLAESARSGYATVLGDSLPVQKFVTWRLAPHVSQPDVLCCNSGEYFDVAIPGDHAMTRMMLQEALDSFRERCRSSEILSGGV